MWLVYEANVWWQWPDDDRYWLRLVAQSQAQAYAAARALWAAHHDTGYAPFVRYTSVLPPLCSLTYEEVEALPW